MLRIFVRHVKSCLGDPEAGIPGLLSKKLSPEALRTYRNCNCPKWVCGTLDGKAHPRTSLNATTWNEAEKALDKIRRGDQRTAGGISVTDALDLWMKEVQLIGLAPGTTRIYQNVQVRLLEFCDRKKIRDLVKLDATEINNWRLEWQTEQTNRRPEPGIKRGTANNRIAGLRLFFAFTRRMRWLKENPMDLVKRQRRQKNEIEEATMPLDEEGDTNYRRFLAAIQPYFTGSLPSQQGGRKHIKRYGKMSSRPDHLSAIAQLMYETGLRVSDAIMFEADRMEVDHDGWASYTTRQRKNGKPVTAGIPAELVVTLQVLPRISPKYVFWDGHTDLEKWNTGQIYRHLQQVGDAIGLPGVRPHRFRDSFAVNRLNAGMSLDDVSKLLGHASVTTTERYYAPFVKSRRDMVMSKRKAAQTPVLTPLTPPDD